MSRTDETDPTLKDVLGAIVSSISHARRISDMEVMRIANFYREHDYLEGLSVPRLRINQVVLDLPVLLGDSIPGESCKANNAEFIVGQVLKNANNFAPQMDLFMSKEKSQLREEIYAILSLLRILLFKERDETLWGERIGKVITEQLRSQLPEVFRVPNEDPQKYKHLPDVVIVDSVRVIVKSALLDLLPKVLEEILDIGFAEDQGLQTLSAQMKSAEKAKQASASAAPQEEGGDPVEQASNLIFQVMMGQVELTHLLKILDLMLKMDWEMLNRLFERVQYPREMYDEQLNYGKSLTGALEMVELKIGLYMESVGEVAAKNQPQLYEELLPRLEEIAQQHIQEIEGSKRGGRKAAKSPEPAPKISIAEAPSKVTTSQRLERRTQLKDLSETINALAVFKEKRKNWSDDDLQNVFSEVVETAVIKQFVEFLSRLAADNAILHRTVSPDFYVRVDTESIKNAGTPQAVTRLRLVLREEGLEWMKEEGTDGTDASWKLLAE